MSQPPPPAAEQPDPEPVMVPLVDVLVTRDDPAPMIYRDDLDRVRLSWPDERRPLHVAITSEALAQMVQQQNNLRAQLAERDADIGWLMMPWWEKLRHRWRRSRRPR